MTTIRVAYIHYSQECYRYIMKGLCVGLCVWGWVGWVWTVKESNFHLAEANSAYYHCTNGPLPVLPMEGSVFTGVRQ